MNASTVITRALSGLGKHTAYKSPGKMPSFESLVWPSKAQNDCSGFVDWCLRFSPTRKVNHPLYKKVNGGWFETTAIHADGMANVGYFYQLERAKPGALLVYPDYLDDDKKPHDGHIGIVVEANAPGIKGVTQIIHCSLGASKTKGDAIQVTGSEIWQAHKSSIIVWLEGLEE